MEKVLKIIFLDFDGVLNSNAQYDKNASKLIFDDMPMKYHINCLNKIVEATDAKVVISSTWRKHAHWSILWRLLQAQGFIGEVIGSTDNMGGPRGLEIKSFIADFNTKKCGRIHFYEDEIQVDKEYIRHFVILDDDDDMQDVGDHLVKTDSDHGLQFHHVQQAIEVLNKYVDRVSI